MCVVQKFYKKAALFVLRAIAKHSPELALIVVQNDGLETIVECLEDFDPGVKEAAAWALGYIARHNKSLAQTAIDAGKIISANVFYKHKENFLPIFCYSRFFFVRRGVASCTVFARTRIVY